MKNDHYLRHLTLQSTAESETCSRTAVVGNLSTCEGWTV